VQKPGRIYIGLQYYARRQYPTGCHDYTYGYLTLMTKDGTIISSMYTDDYTGFNYIEFDFLAPGTYILIIQNQF